MNFGYLFLVIYLAIFQVTFIHSENDILSLLKNDYEKYILLATVSGNLYLINKYNGELKWQTKMDEFVKTKNSNGSMLIPNPISGQLYIFQHNSNDQGLFTQLEHSVFEYVRQTPVFMENMLLTGSKNDHWLSLAMDSGKIINKYRTGDSNNCPQYDINKDNNNHTLHIGICEYNLVVSDASTRHIMYNVVLNSLATHAITDLDHFGLQLYGSSDSGMVVAKHKFEGTEKGWSHVLDSSVIGFYGITSEGVLSRLHFTTMSHDTIDHFLRPGPVIHNNMTLKKSMFFGHNNNNWYVLKVYISEDTTTRSLSRVTPPLITGPLNNMTYKGHISQPDEGPTSGFYELPMDLNTLKKRKMSTINTKYLLDFDRSNITSLVPLTIRKIIQEKVSDSHTKESWPLLIIGTLVTATFLMTSMIFIHLRKHLSRSCDSVSSGPVFQGTLKKVSDDDSIDVGDISYYPKEVLGYGSNGTAVFRGIFHGNNKSVAVKRLIKSDQSHYELQFLRQSFDCSHLIKCFYITESREFTFLALELCECTLEGYVTDGQFQQCCGLEEVSACKQMMSGVHFLHDRGIVHRDLKPRNVMLMRQNKVLIRPDCRGDGDRPHQYKIVITDFGLSRQSQDHGLSITKTGCGGGTSGYMAPEVSRDDIKRITASADIFSCGILYYYVHTKGHHPFGAEVLSRQHNILLGQYSLHQDLVRDQLVTHFITLMLQPDPLDRPTAEEILNGPLFWKSTDKLSFLSDVSDFVENGDVLLQMSLDRVSGDVFLDKWTDCLDPDLVENLTIQRSYKTRLLSHLIRALRNKRNHFHDLPAHLSERLFHSTLDGLATYVNATFPNLFCTLYKWTRSNLVHLPHSVQQYFPSSLYQDQSAQTPPPPLDLTMDTCTRNCGTEVDSPDHDFLEWRKPSRKRPNQPKKQRGTKTTKTVV